MSGKALKSFKDENPDLQKQIGCITGFFQLFDRHRFLTGQRSGSYIQQRPTSGGSSNEIKELNGTMQKAKAKNLKTAREKQQFSTESSITTLSSSSCSSSMSSLEFNRTIQIQSQSKNQIRIPENKNSKVAKKQPDTPRQQSLHFHHIVKDSMHKEARGLSVKTVAKEEKGQTNALKHIDSPRPLRSHKSVNAGVTVTSEPLHTLAKSKKKPWDSPRLSYDETFKFATKHKELPRLSLDSREGSNKGFNEGNKSHNLLKGSPKGYGRNSITTINQLQELETSKRSSSVVAKLMGLDALPECTQTCGSPTGTSSCSTKKNELLARSSTSDEDKQHQRFTLPNSRKADPITNVTYSRFELEPTPWRQPDASQSPRSQASKGSESDIKASKTSLTVYGEIEKRVAELEFKKSGKDLRALKQILEAMQRHKDSLGIAKDQASNSSSDCRNSTNLNESSKLQSPRVRKKDPVSVTVEMSNSTRGSKLPIVIMKPAKITRKPNNPTELSIHGKSGLSKCSLSSPTNGRLVDKQTARGISSTTKNIKDPFGQQVCSSDKNNNMRTTKLMQSLKVSHDYGERSTNSGYMTVTRSPRLQKKFGLERRSQPTSPSSDSSINRREHNRQPVELSSPSTTPRHKFSTLQQRNERFNEISCHWRDFKHDINIMSDFDDKSSSASHSEIEVIRINQSGKIISSSIQLCGMSQNNAFEELRKAETMITAEQPSPVSVLDAAFYRDEPPSPVKKKSDISKNLGEALSTDEDSEESSVDLLQEIDWIDEKLMNFNNTRDPDRKYIAEILLASGLLSGHSSSQIFHSSGHLINPKLFFALEQMKTKRNFNIEDSAKKIPRIINPEQMQRKLIFDVVNDILVQKLILDSSTLWCQSNELAGTTLKGKQLLDELCLEIDQLQPQNRNVSLVYEDENLKHHHAIWTNCCNEMPNILLDIERLIFKDLITEVVRGEVANHPGTHCRQLVFSK